MNQEQVQLNKERIEARAQQAEATKPAPVAPAPAVGSTDTAPTASVSADAPQHEQDSIQAQDAFIKDFNANIVRLSAPGVPRAELDRFLLQNKEKMDKVKADHQEDIKSGKVKVMKVKHVHGTAMSNDEDVPQPHMDHPVLPTPHTNPVDAQVSKL